MPKSLREKLVSRPNLDKALRNSIWLLLERLIRIAVGLAVSILLARHLGPAQFGLLSVAIAFVYLFISIATAGLNGIAVRELVRDPRSADVTIGSVFVLHILGGIAAFLLMLVAVNIMWLEHSPIATLTIVLGGLLLFRTSDTFKYWFEAQVASKYSAWIESGVFLLFSIARIGLVLVGGSVVSVAWTYVAESIAVFVGLLLIYIIKGGVLKILPVNWKRCNELLTESWPYVLTGVAATFLLRIDQIMVSKLLGDSAAGIYSAAIRISESWLYVPIIICSSSFPAIVAAKNVSVEMYNRKIQKLYSVIVMLSVVAAIFIMSVDHWLIDIAYGDRYRQAATVLAISIWVGVPFSLGIAGGKWLVNEGLSILALRRSIYTAVVNIALNYYMIPLYGIEGAAIATVISLFIGNYVIDLFSERTRNMFFQKTRAIIIFGSLK